MKKSIYSPVPLRQRLLAVHRRYPGIQSAIEDDRTGYGQAEQNIAARRGE
jgi:hypothetical protein